MSRVKTHVRKGDAVVVISGVEKGKTGNILQVFPVFGIKSRLERLELAIFYTVEELINFSLGLYNCI